MVSGAPHTTYHAELRRRKIFSNQTTPDLLEHNELEVLVFLGSELGEGHNGVALPLFFESDQILNIARRESELSGRYSNFSLVEGKCRWLNVQEELAYAKSRLFCTSLYRTNIAL